MTVAELMRNNFDAIFIERNPAKREAMMREVYTEDCVWVHPGGRFVGIAAINEAASEVRKNIPEYRYTVLGDIQTMHTVGICRWGSGLPGQPFRYTGTDVVEERGGRVAVFYTFIDSGTPPVSSPERPRSLACGKLPRNARTLSEVPRQTQSDQVLVQNVRGSFDKGV